MKNKQQYTNVDIKVRKKGIKIRIKTVPELVEAFVHKCVASGETVVCWKTDYFYKHIEQAVHCCTVYVELACHLG